jgi:hypothetical protein
MNRGPTDVGMHRLTLTDEDRQARDYLVEKCKSLGCQVSVDAMGNIFVLRRKPYFHVNCYFVAGSLGAVSGTLHSGSSSRDSSRSSKVPLYLFGFSANSLVAGTKRGPATFAGSHLDTQVSLSIVYLTLNIEECSLQGACNSRSTLSYFEHLMSLFSSRILRVYHS